jgi:putative radical SAM enzyme (TIGR03279 family)
VLDLPIEPTPKTTSGLIEAVEPDSLAADLGVQPGDRLIAVNGHPVEDVIDVQFYAAEDDVTLTVQRGAQTLTLTGERDLGQPLGLTFAHPTFDIDIRRCNNLCPFCFVLQTAPRMRRTLYIKDDDYRYSFLFGHYVTLTNLSPHDWDRLAEQHLSPLYVSVHSTDLENRRACLANKTAPDVLAQLRWLGEHGIQVHTQLVITPGLNDGPWMDKSIRDLAALYPTVASVSVVPVGLTKHHKYGRRAHTPAEAAEVLDTVAAWQLKFRAELGVGFVYPTDEWFLVTGRPLPPRKYYDGLDLAENGMGMVRAFLDDWKKVKREIRGTQGTGGTRGRKGPKGNKGSKAAPGPAQLSGRAATLVTATLFEPTLRATAAAFDAAAGTALNVVGITNEKLGPGITVAGLLMGADVLSQLAGRDLGEFVVLPRVMFDHPQGISLDDLSPLTLAQQLGRPIYLADAMGDVLDAFTGANPLHIDPAQPAIPTEVMRAGGWAVEKYL